MNAKTPWHLWVVGIVTLLWNAIGAWDYVMTQMRNEAYLASTMEPAGVSVSEAIAYFEAWPAWADAGWALGVWGAVLGSILLLARSRFAVPAFFISFFGLVVTTLYSIAQPLEMDDTTTPIVFTAIIWIVTLALIIYSRNMVKRGFLR